MSIGGMCASASHVAEILLPILVADKFSLFGSDLVGEGYVGL